MNSELLIVSNEKSFVIDSMLPEFDRLGIRWNVVGFDVKQIEKYKDSADMVLLFVGEYEPENLDVLVYIKDICADDAKTLFIGGYEGELSKVTEIIPLELVSRRFVRPFDAKVIVGRISEEDKLIWIRNSMKEILLVDDDVTFLKMVKKWLMGKYHVTVVKSGMQAIKYITTHKPDLILMDYEMPITTGSKVMEMLRSDPDSADIPVIFLTGKSDKETVMQVMNLKPQGYLLKTMDRESIIGAIDKYFETEKWQNAVNISELH